MFVVATVLTHAKDLLNQKQLIFASKKIGSVSLTLLVDLHNHIVFKSC